MKLENLISISGSEVMSWGFCKENWRRSYLYNQMMPLDEKYHERVIQHEAWISALMLDNLIINNLISWKRIPSEMVFWENYSGILERVKNPGALRIEREGIRFRQRSLDKMLSSLSPGNWKLDNDPNENAEKVYEVIEETLWKKAQYEFKRCKEIWEEGKPDKETILKLNGIFPSTNYVDAPFDIIINGNIKLSSRFDKIEYIIDENNERKFYPVDIKSADRVSAYHIEQMHVFYIPFKYHSTEVIGEKRIQVSYGRMIFGKLLPNTVYIELINPTPSRTHIAISNEKLEEIIEEVIEIAKAKKYNSELEYSKGNCSLCPFEGLCK